MFSAIHGSLKSALTCTGSTLQCYQKLLHSCAPLNAANREGRMMMKIMQGSRVSKKKHWYREDTQNKLNETANVGFLGVSGGSKLNIRRQNVLNKLFMLHITEQMASDEVVYGKNLQITKVKVATDFSCVNVYWLSDTLYVTKEGAGLASILENYSHTLRSNLSRLRIIGQVPRIRFVPDKLGATSIQVEKLLGIADFGEVETEETQYFNNFSQTCSTSPKKSEWNEETDRFPTIKHDIFEVDHAEIMARIKRQAKKMSSKPKPDESHIYTESSGKMDISEINSAIQQIADFRQKSKIHKEGVAGRGRGSLAGSNTSLPTLRLSCIVCIASGT
ncbi:hypothetical protein B566_EDAN004401 [Ephemera danica]|nr:hypothetical protein B566_EDAN004401 [Ephemera danica]